MFSTFSGTSWFIKWVLFFNGSFEGKSHRGSLDSCMFIRGIIKAVLLSIVLAICASLISFLLVFAPLTQAYDLIFGVKTFARFHNLAALGLGVDIVAVLINAIAFALYYIEVYIDNHPKKGYVPPAPPGQFKVLYTSWKGRYCTKVTLIDLNY